MFALLSAGASGTLARMEPLVHTEPLEGPDFTEEVPAPALITRTSGEILARKGLPRVIDGRSVTFLLGPLGVGKTTVAQRIVAAAGARAAARGRTAGEAVTDVCFRKALVDAVRRGRWPDALRRAPTLLFDDVDFLEQRYGATNLIGALLRERAEAGLRTVLCEGQADGSVTALYATLPLHARATILLRFPVGRGRRNYVRTRAAELGVPWERAREAVGLEPWSYGAVEAALRGRLPAP